MTEKAYSWAEVHTLMEHAYNTAHPVVEYIDESVALHNYMTQFVDLG